MLNRSHDISSAVAGTCEWLLRHETYKTWAASDRGLLWVKGKPGSGKSTLLKHALGNHASGDSALVLSFFFHGRGDELQRTPLGLFRSLLHQVLRQAPDALQDLVDSFKTKCEERGKPGKDWHWHEEELFLLFESALPRILSARSVWLFADALDECGNDNAVRRLVRIFKSLLKRLPPHSAGLGQFRICFSCRHYPILDADDSVLEICVERENYDDISTFVDDQLATFRAQTSSTIPALITKGASGVFLWARLVVERVLNLELDGVGLNKIEAEVRSTPGDLDELYRQLILGMDSACLKLVQWICFATRPLSMAELRWAMVVDADCPHRSLQACKSAEDYVPENLRMRRQVQTLSRGLAETIYAEGAHFAQFIHQSVKDFFVENLKDLLALDGCETPAEAAIRAHFRLSKICIRFLAMEEIGPLMNDDQNDENIDDDSDSDMDEDSDDDGGENNDFAFLHYATTSWVAHTQQCDAGSVPQEDLLELLAWPSNALVELWTRLCQEINYFAADCPRSGTRLLHVLSRYGVLGLVTAILQRTSQLSIHVEARDAVGQTPLLLAAENGHEAVVKLLLGMGKANIDASDFRGQTALSRAATNGHAAIVKLLLSMGKANIDAKDYRYQTALLRAAANGHEDVVKLLISTGKVNLDAKDYASQTPLSRAAANGHAAIVKLLLGTGEVDIDAKDNDGVTALSWAVQNGHKPIVELLLDTGKVDVHVEDSGGMTALSQANKNGDRPMIKLLLGTGKFDVDAEAEAEADAVFAGFLALPHSSVVSSSDSSDDSSVFSVVF
jgi:hypothetical protein